MALVKCVECGAEISEKALACPQCGCPRSSLPERQKCPECGNVLLTDHSGPCTECGHPNPFGSLSGVESETTLIKKQTRNPADSSQLSNQPSMDKSDLVNELEKRLSSDKHYKEQLADNHPIIESAKIGCGTCIAPLPFLFLIGWIFDAEEWAEKLYTGTLGSIFIIIGAIVFVISLIYYYKERAEIIRSRETNAAKLDAIRYKISH